MNRENLAGNKGEKKRPDSPFNILSYCTSGFGTIIVAYLTFVGSNGKSLGIIIVHMLFGSTTAMK